MADADAAGISHRETEGERCNLGTAASKQPKMPRNIRLTRINGTPRGDGLQIAGLQAAARTFLVTTSIK